MNHASAPDEREKTRETRRVPSMLRVRPYCWVPEAGHTLLHFMHVYYVLCTLPIYIMYVHLCTVFFMDVYIKCYEL